MFARLRIKNHELRIKNLILNILFMTLASLFMIHPVYAQTSISTPSANPYTSPSGEAGLTPIPSYISPTSPLYTDMLLNNLFHTFSCIASGQSVIGQPCLTYQITKNAQGITQSIPIFSSVDTSGGLLGTTTYLIGALYDSRPLKTSDYLASVGQDLGIIKIANAQVAGSGAGILTPILKLWQVSRNISYVIMIIIFIVIGLMIIFRNKINPQTVITAQAALPGLVIGLILITFSYFLAALLADTAFIGTNLVGAYFSAAQTRPGSSVSAINLSTKLKDESVLSIMSKFVGSAKREDLETAVNSVLNNIGSGPKAILSTVAGFLSYQYYINNFSEAGHAIGGTAYCAIALAIGAPGILTGSAGTTASNMPTCFKNTREWLKVSFAIIFAAQAALFPAATLSWALYFILIAIVIYTMFKLLFRLVTAFLTIIVYTVFAPFQFMVASLPGRQGIATGWILNMLSNILAFPAVIAVFYFVNYLLGNSIDALPVTGGPLELKQSGTFPLLANLNESFYRLILAFGALIATPSIPDIVARAIGKASEAGQLIGGEISGGIRSGRGYVGQTGGALGGLNKTGEGMFDKPAYILRNGKWVRTNVDDPNLTADEALRAGVSPGGYKKYGAPLIKNVKKIFRSKL